jgi:hypothetical protein
LSGFVKQSTSGPEFLRRTLIASLVTGILVGLALAWRFGWPVGTSFLVALLWGLANFAALAGVLKTATDPGGVRKLRLTGLVGVKVAIYAIGIAILVSGRLVVVPAAAGFGWPLLIGLLRALGAVLTNRESSTET